MPAPSAGEFHLADPRNIPANGCARLSFLRCDDGIVRGADGTQQHAAAANANPILDIHNLQFYDGTVETIAGSASNGTSGATSAIQRDLNSAWSGVTLDNAFNTPADGRYTAVIAPWAAETKGRMIVSNNVKIKSWQGVAGTMSDVTGAFPCRYLLVGPDSRLFMFWVQEGGGDRPMRVRWSVIGLPNGSSLDFTDPGSGALDLTYDSWQITAAWNQTGRIFVGKERSLCALVATGDSTNAYAREIIHRSEGVFAPDSLVQHGDLTAFMSHRNFILFDGVNFQDVGGPVRRDLFKRLNYGALRQITSEVDGPNNRVGWGLPMDGNSYPSELWWLNLGTGAWECDKPRKFRSISIYTNVDFTTVDELVGTVDALGGTVDNLSSTVSTKEKLIFGSSSGASFITSETAAPSSSATFISAAFKPVGARSDTGYIVNDRDSLVLDEINLVLADYGTNYNVQVNVSTDSALTWTNVGTIALTASPFATPTAPRLVEKFLHARMPLGSQFQIQLIFTSTAANSNAYGFTQLYARVDVSGQTKL